MPAPNYRHLHIRSGGAKSWEYHEPRWSMKTMPKARSLGGSTVGPLGMLKDRVNTQTELLDFFLKKETCLRYFWWKLFILRYRIRTNLKFLNMSENPFLRMNKVPYLNFVVSTNTNHAQSCPLPFSHKRVALFFDTNAEACSGKGASVISFSSPWLEVDIW